MQQAPGSAMQLLIYMYEMFTGKRCAAARTMTTLRYCTEFSVNAMQNARITAAGAGPQSRCRAFNVCSRPVPRYAERLPAALHLALRARRPSKTRTPLPRPGRRLRRWGDVKEEDLDVPLTTPEERETRDREAAFDEGAAVLKQDFEERVIAAPLQSDVVSMQFGTPMTKPVGDASQVRKKFGNSPPPEPA